jgi:hypothetical protein
MADFWRVASTNDHDLSRAATSAGAAHHIRAIPCISACVIYCWQSFVGTQHQRECLVKLLAVIKIKLSALEHLPQERRPTHARAIKILIPELQVLDCRVQTGSTDCVKICHAKPEGTVFVFSLIPQCIVFHDFRVIVSKIFVCNFAS